MSTHRADIDMSAQYKPMEDVFIQIGKGQKDDPVYKMNSAEKDCLDTFMMARNNELVWGKTDVDENGRPRHIKIVRGCNNGDVICIFLLIAGRSYWDNQQQIKMFND